VSFQEPEDDKQTTPEFNWDSLEATMMQSTPKQAEMVTVVFVDNMFLSWKYHNVATKLEDEKVIKSSLKAENEALCLALENMANASNHLADQKIKKLSAELETSRVANHSLEKKMKLMSEKTKISDQVYMKKIHDLSKSLEDSQAACNKLKKENKDISATLETAKQQIKEDQEIQDSTDPLPAKKKRRLSGDENDCEEPSCTDKVHAESLTAKEKQPITSDDDDGEELSCTEKLRKAFDQGWKIHQSYQEGRYYFERQQNGKPVIVWDHREIELAAY